MAMFSEDAIQRSTSAPPAQGSHLLFESWGPLALQQVPTSLNPRFPREFEVRRAHKAAPPAGDRTAAPLSTTPGSTVTSSSPAGGGLGLGGGGGSSGGGGVSLAQPRARHPGTIGTPIPQSPEPQRQLESPFHELPFVERPKSVMDLIQEDFPRTPSPVFSGHHPLKGGLLTPASQHALRPARVDVPDHPHHPHHSRHPHHPHTDERANDSDPSPPQPQPRPHAHHHHQQQQQQQPHQQPSAAAHAHHQFEPQNHFAQQQGYASYHHPQHQQHQHHQSPQQQQHHGTFLPQPDHHPQPQPQMPVHHQTQPTQQQPLHRHPPHHQPHHDLHHPYAEPSSSTPNGVPPPSGVDHLQASFQMLSLPPGMDPTPVGVGGGGTAAGPKVLVDTSGGRTALHDPTGPDPLVASSLPPGALPGRPVVFPVDSSMQPQPTQAGGNGTAYYPSNSVPVYSPDPRALYRLASLPASSYNREVYYPAAGGPRVPTEYVAVVPMAGHGHGGLFFDPHQREAAQGRIVFYPALDSDPAAFQHPNAPPPHHHQQQQQQQQPLSHHLSQRHQPARTFREEGAGGLGGKARHNGGGRRGEEKSREPSRAKKGSRNVSLLDEFRSSGKSRHWDLAELTGHIVQFCQDQHGSRFIQQKIEVATVPEKNLIFNEILPHARELMVDVFGNYVIQKIFEYGAPDHRDLLVAMLQGRAVQLALQMYGCRVIQKALEVLDTSRLVPLVREFKWQVMNCVHDQNGNHVIQKCIEVLSVKTGADGQPSSEIQFIIDAFLGHVRQLSTHPYGCRVIQRILEHCASEQKFVVLDEILSSVQGLIQDQYGNYVVQHVIQFGRPGDRLTVVNEVRQNLLAFAQHKFASNVVEKCLQYGSQEQKNAIVDEITSPGENRPILLIMIRDQYANYVVQKVIDLSEKRQLNDIVEQLRAHASAVKRCTYGKHILARVEKATGIKI